MSQLSDFLSFVSSLALVVAAGGAFTPGLGRHRTFLSIKPLDPGDNFSAGDLKSIDSDQL